MSTPLGGPAEREFYNKIAEMQSRITELERSLVNAPGREVASNDTGVAQSGIGTALTSLTNQVVTFNAVAGQQYTINALVNFQKLTSAGEVYVAIWKDGYGTLNTALQSYAVGEYGTLSFVASDVPGGVAVTYRLRASVSVGTVTVNPLSLSTAYSHIKVVTSRS